MRGKLRRLERAARGNLESFELEDGRCHYCAPTSPELFLHSMDRLRAQSERKPFPEPLERVRAIARARKREHSAARGDLGCSADNVTSGRRS
jgi:hypothetical protein